ncbi:hypothetical protein BDW71DRAFT_183140, partial [Aspergillus fruticulosus]
MSIQRIMRVGHHYHRQHRMGMRLWSSYCLRRVWMSIQRMIMVGHRYHGQQYMGM